MSHFLCRLEEIPDPGSRGFRVNIDGQETAVFIVHQGGSVSAFRNSCPHTGVNLEWVPDQFLDSENCHIQCSLHGALFEVQTGICIRGPCAGQSLQGLKLENREGELWLNA